MTAEGGKDTFSSSSKDLMNEFASLISSSSADHKFSVDCMNSPYRLYTERVAHCFSRIKHRNSTSQITGSEIRIGVVEERRSVGGKSFSVLNTCGEKHLSSAGLINAGNQLSSNNFSSDNLTSLNRYSMGSWGRQSIGGSSKDKPSCCAIASTNKCSP